MRKSVLILTLLSFFSVLSFADSVSIKSSSDFVAPVVQDKDSLTNTAPAGAIVYDASDALPFMLDPSGNWRPLGQSTGLGNSYTPTISWSSGIGTVLGFWRRLGDQIEVQVYIPCTGAVTAAGLTVDLPSGLTFDTTKFAAPSPSVDNTALGSVTILDSGSATYVGTVTYLDTNTVRINVHQNTGANFVRVTSVTNTTPVTLGASDEIGIRFSGPISGWD